MDKYSVLKEYYGYNSFKDGQALIIDKILNKQDTIAILKTGGGKSLTFQIPAILFDGLTIVVSPLISLMKDQVLHLVNSGIKADFINSSKDYLEIKKTYENIKRKKIKLLYISPERLTNTSFLEVINKVTISQITIDEAHCISLWGRDFRNSYLNISGFINSFKIRPVISVFTATANERVITDIKKILNLENPFIVKTSFDRKNLFYSVAKPENKIEYLINFINKYKNVSGIIYTVTRHDCILLFDKLKSLGYPVLIYHGELSQAKKNVNQKKFLEDSPHIMIATNAFGMGIDKPNIRYVINYSIPLSIEDLVQQMGRACRDGEKGISVLLFSYKDVYVNRYFIENLDFLDLEKSKIYELKCIKQKQLKDVIGYANTSKCLHKYILEYFNEETKDFCNNCSNCNTNYKEVDLYKEVINIFNFLKFTNEKYGYYLVLNTLSGTKNKYTNSKKLIKNKFFNSSKIKKFILKNLLDSLLEDGFLKKTVGDYPLIKLTSSSKKLYKKNKYILKIRCDTNIIKEVLNDKILTTNLLYKNLEEYRNYKAKEEGIVNYMVFTVRTIKEITTKKPKNIFELKNIYGISDKKIAKYGLEVIDIVKKCKNNC